MIITHVSAEHFGSYKEFNLHTSDLGLSLIYGPTGAGKSTILDMVCWTLFGKTAKDGSVDEVRSWMTPNTPTSATTHLRLSDSEIYVTRIRGNTKQNDLYWVEPDTEGKHIRGKNINETQSLLEKRIGVTYPLFVAGSYFSEFSPSGSFFTAKAPARRALLETFVSLDLPIQLAEAASGKIKTLTREQSTLARVQSMDEGAVKVLSSQVLSLQNHGDNWDRVKSARLAELRILHASFHQTVEVRNEAQRTKSEAWETAHNDVLASLADRYTSALSKTNDPVFSNLDEKLKTLQQKLQKLETAKCKECGGPSEAKSASKVRDEIADLNKKASDLRLLKDRAQAIMDKLEAATDEVNPHTIGEEPTTNPYGGELAKLEAETNPYHSQLQEVGAKLNHHTDSLTSTLLKLAELEASLHTHETLKDLASKLRAQLLQSSVEQLQEETNRILDTHFDAELRVTFEVTDSDDLEVAISKSGYQAVYTQLSKGQRQLLKLAFGIAVQKVASNNAGIHFENLFLDESLDGLDPDTKVKAFGLFQELETQHRSILVIDHAPEFHQLFNKRYRVSLDADCSKMEVDN